MSARRFILFRQEATAQGWLDAQHIEVIARNDHPQNPLGVRALAERYRGLRVAYEALEDLIAVAIVDEVRVVGHWGETVGAGGVDENQPVRFFDGQLLDQHLIDEAEDGRVETDAKGQ